MSSPLLPHTSKPQRTPKPRQIGRPVTNACLDGFNGTIFCYGQTGSGKTYTTFGPPPRGQNEHDDHPGEASPGGGDAGVSTPPPDAASGKERGLVPRVLEYLFDRFALQAEAAKEVRVGDMCFIVFVLFLLHKMK